MLGQKDNTHEKDRDRKKYILRQAELVQSLEADNKGQGKEKNSYAKGQNIPRPRWSCTFNSRLMFQEVSVILLNAPVSQKDKC